MRLQLFFSFSRGSVVDQCQFLLHKIHIQSRLFFIFPASFHRNAVSRNVIANKIWLWSPCLRPNFSISPPHSCSSTVFLETNLSMGKHSKVIVPLSKGKKIQRNKEPTCPNWILHVLCTTVIPFSAKTIFLKVSNHYQDLGRHVPILTGRLLGDLHMQYKIHCNLHFHHHFHQLTTNHPLTALLHFHSPF